jgi:peptidoglycan/LPS O-acetylase OafA/YrhL
MHWMDLLRGGAVVLVVIFHAGNFGDALEPVKVFNVAVGSYRLPALFLASGLLLDRSLAKGSVSYFSGKLRLIVWPYIIWTGLIMLPLIDLSRGLNPAWWIHPTGSHTWFLSSLAAIYAVGYLTRIVPPGWIALGFLVANQLIDVTAFELGPFLHQASWGGVFFFLGVMLSRHVDTLVAAPVWAFVIGACVTVVWSALRVLPDPPAGRSLLGTLVTAIGVGTIIWVLARLPRVWPLRLLEWLGRRSIVTYLLHVPVLRIAVTHLGWPRDDWAGFLSLVTTILIICMLATQFYPRIRWLFEWPGRGRNRTDRSGRSGPHTVPQVLAAPGSAPEHESTGHPPDGGAIAPWPTVISADSERLRRSSSQSGK